MNFTSIGIGIGTGPAHPYRSSTPSGPGPSQDRASGPITGGGTPTNERPPGIVHSKRPKAPTHLTQDKIDKILKAQSAHGVLTDGQIQRLGGTQQHAGEDSIEGPAESTDVEPPPVTSASVRLPSPLQSLTDWFTSLLHPEPTESDGNKPVNKVAIATYPFWQSPAMQRASTAGFDLAKDTQPYVAALEKIFGEGNVVIIDNPRNAYPFLRNLAMVDAVSGTLVTGWEPPDRGEDVMRDAIEQSLEGHQVPRVRLKTEFNFANVAQVSKDVLVIADAQKSQSTEEMRNELCRALGNPTHVLRVWLAEKGVSHTAPAGLCYDLDLAFHVSLNVKGKPVAFVHRPCIASSPKSEYLSAKDFVSELQRLGFEVVVMSAADQAVLAANSVSNPDRPGEMLFTRDGLSEKFLSELDRVGITPVFPDAPPYLGWISGEAAHAKATFDVFGVHCVCLNFLSFTESAPDVPQDKDL